MMPENVYNIMKYVQRIALPALCALITALGTALGFESETTVLVISAICTFLGALLAYDYNSFIKNGGALK